MLDAELGGVFRGGVQGTVEETKEELEQEEPVVYDGPGYAVIHRGQKPQPRKEQPPP